MTNIDIRVVATANVTQMKAAFGQLETQVAGVNKELASMVNLQHGVDPAGFAASAKAAANIDKNFRNAVASTGMFEQSQVRINSATDDYIKKLNTQKMSFRQMYKERDIAAKAYREQLAMENMVISKPAVAATKGKAVVDATVPNAVAASADTASKRMAFFNRQLESGSKSLVNWGKNTQWAGRQLTVGLAVPMAAAAAAAGVMAYQIDQQMTRVLKVYNTTASATDTSVQGQIAYEKELQQVRQESMATALNAAKTYGSSAKDTLAVQAELAAQGLRGQKLQQQTTQIMRVSQLGEIDYQTAIKASISLQNVFHQNTKQLADSFNYMNSVENATSLETKDFAAAIPIAAAPVKLFGGNIKELGTLLVAMKSRGIEATQGANAIKAAMQRLARPSKTIREEWQAITGTDITQIYRNSHGLIDLFTKISNATKNLAPKDQIKAFAGLFGTYQVSRMVAMTKGMEDLQNGVGQVSTAYQIAQQSSSQWADVANQEIKQTNESLSGTFKRTLSTLQIEMANIGKSFVPVVTIILKGITAIIEFINKLPKGFKVIGGIGLGLMAIAGPITMLVGLFANLTGTVLGLVAGIGKLFFKMDILDKESRVGKMASELQSAGFMKERDSAELLRESIEKLTLAWAAAAKAAGIATEESAASAAALRAAAVLPTGIVPGKAGGPARVAAAEGSYMMTVPGYATGQATEAAKAAESTRKLKTYAAAGAASTAAMATGMALTATSSNKTAQSIGNFLMISSLALPAISKIGPKILTAGKAALGLSAAAEGAAAGTEAAAGAAGVLGLGIGGAALAMTGVGALAIAAGVGIYAWRKHISDAKKEQDRLNASVYNMTDAWAAATGTAKKQWAGVAMGEKLAISQSKEAKLYSEYSTGDMKSKTQDYVNNKDLSPNDRFLVLQKHFVELQAVYGKSEKDAEAHVRALMQAAGRGLDEQNYVLTTLRKNIGAIKQSNVSEWLQTEIDALNTGKFEVNTDKWKTAAQSVSEAFVSGFNKNASPEEAKKLIDKFGKVATQEWTNQFNSLSNDSAIKSALDKFGYTTAEKLRKALEKPGGKEKFNSQMTSMWSGGLLNFDQINQIIDATGKAQDAESTFVQAVANGNTVLGRSLKDIKDGQGNFDALYNDWTVKAERMTLKQAQSSISSLFDSIKSTGSATEDMIGHFKGIGAQASSSLPDLRHAVDIMSTGEKTQLAAAVSVIAQKNGIKLSGDLAHRLAQVMGTVKTATEGAARAAGKFASNTAAAKAAALDSVRSLEKTAATSAQQDVADAVQAKFDAQMQAQTDARQKYWDNRTTAQSNAFDRQTKALDNKWTKRTDSATKYWDNRIKKVNDEMKAEQKADDNRQKIFQAEMDRMKRLADAANSNIDFNAALNSGQFDAAAKIRNDQMATDVQNAISDAMAKDSQQSQNHQDKLQKQVDAMGTKKDAYLKGLARQETAQKDHLKKVQDAQAAGLKSQEDANMKALAAEQDAEKKSFADRLALFMSHIAKNKAELKQYMTDAGIAYNAYGENWASYFGSRLKFHVTEAANSLRSDSSWAKLGESAAAQIVKGMGFKSWAQFVHFTQTGDMGNGSSKGPSGHPAKTPGHGNGPLRIPGKLQSSGVIPTFHEGGWIGSGKSSRKGVAQNNGLHPTEQLILAKKKEFVVNERAAQKHAPILEAMNSGKMDSSRGNIGNGVGGDRPITSIIQNPVGALTAGLMQGLVTGFAKNVNNLFTAAQTKFAGANGGSYAAGKAGTYANINLDTEQLKNAATIASVGSSMGMSTRDIEIAIMTSMTESGLRNLHSGDRDSQGLFQQRPSMGWGTAEQITTPAYAARKFYMSLKGEADRNKKSPWLAAQGVQRSAFSDGSNYEQYWNLAKAIFNKGIMSSGVSAGFRAGAGNWQMPGIPGKGWENTHDYRNGLNSPLFAYNDGVVVESRAITSGGSPGNGFYTTPYRSYGETIVIRGDDGNEVRQAHLAPGKRFVKVGQRVPGGSLIGLSGQTGNATGPHTHYEVNGQEIARDWFFSHGIGLKTGGTVKKDGTAAVLHKDERVLTAPLTSKLDFGIDAIYKLAKNAQWSNNNLASINRSVNLGAMGNNVANEGNVTYNLVVNANNANASAEDIAQAAVRLIKQSEARKPQSRRN